MTNEGLVASGAEASTEEREHGVVAYIGRASFRMEHTPPPGNDNQGGGAIVQPASHEDTMRIRIPAPAPDSAPSVAWAPADIDIDRDIVELPPGLGRRVVASIGEALVARLELPRWILASMTALVFAGGVLVAASVIGGTRPALAVRPPAPAPVAPPAAAPPAPVVEPALPAVAQAEPAAPRAPVVERPVATRRAPRPAAPPVRRAPKKAAPPPPSSSAGSGESLIAAATPAAGWVDPFAE